MSASCQTQHLSRIASIAALAELRSAMHTLPNSCHGNHGKSFGMKLARAPCPARSSAPACAVAIHGNFMVCPLNSFGMKESLVVHPSLNAPTLHHGLCFPPQKLRSRMLLASPSPRRYRVWVGLSFGLRELPCGPNLWSEFCSENVG